MNVIFLIITAVFLSLMLVGFLIGYFRGWCKSLIRLCILIACFLLSLFIVPHISNSFNIISSEGTKIIIFGQSIDILSFIKSQNFNDLDMVMETTTSLASSLSKVILNLLMFIISFLILSILSYIIFAVVSFIIGRIVKQEKIEEIEEKNQEQNKNSTASLKNIKNNINGENLQSDLSQNKKEQKHKKEKVVLPKPKIWVRLIGGGIGTVSSVVVFLALLVPMFGIMNTLDKAMVSKNSQNTASAVSLDNAGSLVCGELYYTEDETIGKIESLIEKYSLLRKKYNRSFTGAVLRVSGIEKLGTLSFNYLTNIEVNNKTVKLTDEFSTMFEVYDAYKENFVRSKFNIKDEDALKKIKSIYNASKKSEYVKKYIEDIIPNLAKNWSEGNSFAGISNPIPQKYNLVTNNILNVFALTKSFNNIDNNLCVVLDFLQTASEDKIIEDFINGKDFLDILEENDNFIENLILSFSTTFELKTNLPNILNGAIVLMYEEMVGDGAFVYEPSQVKVNEINFNSEAKIIQNLTSTVVEMSKLFNSNSENEDDEDKYIDELGTIGKAIDYARQSKMLSTPLKKFIICYINSDKVDFGENSNSIKETLISYIDEKWDIEQNPDFSFETTFVALSETVKLANKILNDIKDISIDNLSDVLEKVIENDSVKEVVSSVLNENLIYDIVGDDDASELLTDVIGSIVKNTTSESLKNDIQATQAVIDIISKGGKENLTQEESSDIIEKIAQSETIINLIDKSVKDDSKSALQSLVSDISAENKDTLLGSIENSQNLSDETKNILSSLINF